MCEKRKFFAHPFDYGYYNGYFSYFIMLIWSYLSIPVNAASGLFFFHSSFYMPSFCSLKNLKEKCRQFWSKLIPAIQLNVDKFGVNQLNVDNFGVNHAIFYKKPAKNHVYWNILYICDIDFLHFFLRKICLMSTFLA